MISLWNKGTKNIRLTIDEQMKDEQDVVYRKEREGVLHD